MKRSSRMAAGVMGLVMALLATALRAEEPAKKAEPVKPPWQRMLQGDDAKKAAEQEKKLAQLQEAGRFAEALKLAEALAELRAKKQGADHWEAVNARFTVEAIRCLLRATKEEQQSYKRSIVVQREAEALFSKGHYREAQPLFERVLSIRRKVLGEEHPYTAESYAWLALTLDHQGKYQEAEEIQRKFLAIRRKVLGEEHPSTAIAYDNLAITLNHQGKDQEAEEIQRKVLAIIRKVLGEEHYNTAITYGNLAITLNNQDKYQEAEEIQRKVLAIFRKVGREEHPNTVRSYNGLAANLNAQGKYKEAEEGARKALAICRKVLGEDHPDTATSYAGLAYSLYAQGKYRQAEEIQRKALAIRRKVLGEAHPRTAITYGNLALTLEHQGKYQEAEEIQRKFLAIRRKVLGEEHPSTAIAYDNLATTLDYQGKYQEAEEIQRKVLATFRKVLGEEHSATALSYSNLAGTLNHQGKYQEAAEIQRKVLAIIRKVGGEEHPNTAHSYDGLANSLDAQGKYLEAEKFHRKALAIRRKMLAEEHPDLADSYNNLARNLLSQGKYHEAEEGFRKALAIDRKALGEEHPTTATTYNNVGVSLSAQGKYQEAEEDLRKALSIRLKALGEEHRQTALSYNNVADNLNDRGKYQEAEKNYRKALAIFRKTLGDEHSWTTRSYETLAFNLNFQGKYHEAEAFFLRAANSFTAARLHVAAAGLERAAFTSEHLALPALAAVLARNGKPDDAWQRFEESLARGTWDDLSARLRRPQEERDKQAQLTARIDRLNKLIEKASAAKPTPEQKKHRDELLSQLRQAYDELAAFAQQLEKQYGPIAGQVFARAQIQKALPQDAALIAWLDIAGRPKAADPNGEHWAILLRSTGPPVWVRLSGSGDKNAWTDADTQLPSRLRAALQSAGSDWQPLADRLRKQRLDPLAPHLKGVRRLIVLPSTALAGVPVEAITDKYTVSYAHSGTMYAHLLRQPPAKANGLFVLADPVFDMPTEKEKPQPLPPGGVLLTMVLRGSNAAKAGLKPNDVLLRYGDTDLAVPQDFKPQPEANDPNKRVPVIVWREGKQLARPLFVRPGKLGVAIAKEPALQAVAEQRRINHLLASRGGDDGNWPRLPGTRIEAASLHRLFDKDAPVQLLLDSEASEQRLNDLAQRGDLGKYRYVHLATHGEVNNVFPLRSAVILSRDHLPDDKQRTELLVSGQPIPDGRLEAEEALRRWNLNADLVTLSACQTALGKYERGEGFVGFAQSLILCGTRSVCLSLWKVDDTATALLMERFYQNLLGKRDGLKAPMAKAAALAEAKTWLRTLSREQAIQRAASLTEGVSRGKGAAKLPPLEVPPAAAKADDRPFAHPRYWAAFILTGDPE